MAVGQSRAQPVALTWSGATAAGCFISANEGKFTRQYRDNYYLYWVSNEGDNLNPRRFYAGTSKIEDVFKLTSIQYQEFWS